MYGRGNAITTSPRLVVRVEHTSVCLVASGTHRLPMHGEDSSCHVSTMSSYHSLNYLQVLIRLVISNQTNLGFLCVTSWCVGFSGGSTSAVTPVRLTAGVGLPPMRRFEVQKQTWDSSCQLHLWAVQREGTCTCVSRDHLLFFVFFSCKVHLKFPLMCPSVNFQKKSAFMCSLTYALWTDGA